MSPELHQSRTRSVSVDGIHKKLLFDITGAKIAIIGLDPDGFSLAGVAASRGFETIGFDPDEVKVAQLAEYTSEHSARNLLITSDSAELRSCDVFVICSPTDAGAGSSDLTQLEAAVALVGAVIREGGIVIVESVVYPGVCEHTLLPVLEKHSGMPRPAPEKTRASFYFAHAPVPRKGSRRAIGAANAESLSRAVAFYRALGVETVPMRSIKDAEAVPMVADSLHDVVLALSNEFSILFDRVGIDIADVSRAIRMDVSIYPGITLAQTSASAYYLSRSGHEHEIDQQFLTTARRIVEYMPTYVTNVLIEVLGGGRRNLKGSTVALLGISDGNGTGEDGIGAKIKAALEKKGAIVRAYDPDVAGAGFDLKETLEGADAAVIASDHALFHSLNPRQFEELGVSVVIDATNALDKDLFEKSPITYRGIGRG